MHKCSALVPPWATKRSTVPVAHGGLNERIDTRHLRGGPTHASPCVYIEELPCANLALSSYHTLPIPRATSLQPINQPVQASACTRTAAECAHEDAGNCNTPCLATRQSCMRAPAGCTLVTHSFFKTLAPPDHHTLVNLHKTNTRVSSSRTKASPVQLRSVPNGHKREEDAINAYPSHHAPGRRGTPNVADRYREEGRPQGPARTHCR